MKRRTPIFRAVSALLLLTTTACVSWRPYEASPTSPPSGARTIRLHLHSGGTVQLRDAFVVGDSMWVGERSDVTPPHRAQIPVTEVRSVEEAHYPLGGTRGRIIVAAVAVGLLVWAAVEIGKNGLGIGSLGGG